MINLFVILAGFSQASVEFIRRILPVGTSSLAVATIISLSGGFLGLLALTVQGKWQGMSKSAVVLSVLAGLLVLLLDIFLVSAYSKGLKLNVGIPLFLGATLIFGFVYSSLAGEKINWMSLSGTVLILLGSVLLTTSQK